ncbi:dihydropteroate synthase [Herbihabitans rhizosphaerae]|uniref:dihydropteroate synthase n=1 Tax=Herbihabitans rhizosphaerae TaxID=1872711 RepID=UPI001F5F9628|nr:dihydropteroate synthase [Herbihabitans rhizosphaerae]
MTDLQFGGKTVSHDRALVMAIVNRTRDSFYDKGSTFAEHAAPAAVDRAVAEGADIVDIDGVRAGARGEVVDVTEEIARMVPVVVAAEFGVGLEDRVDGTLAAISVAAWAGATVFRAHEVRPARMAPDMVAGIAGTRPPARCVRVLA